MAIYVRVSAAAWIACCNCEDSLRHFANFSLGIALSSHAPEMHRTVAFRMERSSKRAVSPKWSPGPREAMTRSPEALAFPCASPLPLMPPLLPLLPPPPPLPPLPPLLPPPPPLPPASVTTSNCPLVTRYTEVAASP